VEASQARILVCDDDPVARTMLRAHLRGAGHDVRLAEDGFSALAAVHEAAPDVLLLDLELPDLHGLEVLDRLKADPAYAALPVIVLTGHSEEPILVEALRRGAQDYVVKPPSWPVLDARIDVALRLSALQDELRAANARLEGLATTDALTGVANRRHGESLLDAAAHAGQEGLRPVVVKVDVDRFKLVNDVYGHAVGDEVLRRVAEALGGVLRKGDHVVRWGGDEFVGLLHHADDAGAAVVAERMRRAVGRDPELDALGGVSVSIGWAAWQPGLTGPELLAEADRAMYEAKRAGRDSVRAA
jgi:diguanylate cyclase (GGDEF)-like protein